MIKSLLERLNRLQWDDPEVSDPAKWLRPDGWIQEVNYHTDILHLLTAKEKAEAERKYPQHDAGLSATTYLMVNTGIIRIPAYEDGSFEVDCLGPEPTDAQKRHIGKLCREVGCWWEVSKGGNLYDNARDQFTAEPLWDALRRCRVGQ